MKLKLGEIYTFVGETPNKGFHKHTLTLLQIKGGVMKDENGSNTFCPLVTVKLYTTTSSSV